MYRRAYSLLIGSAVCMFGMAFLVSTVYERPLVEPEGKLLGPSLTWLLELFGALPTNTVLLSLVLLVDVVFRALTILLAALLADLVARSLWQSRGKFSQIQPMARARFASHWTRERMTLVVLGIVCFYITYVSYRNLKSNLPFVRPDPSRAPGEVKPLSYDRELHIMDRVLFFGNDPSDVMHAIFGTTISAHVLSQIYLTYLPLVVVLVTVWVVWSRNISFGYWFVTSQVVGWSLGTLSYYLLPTLGPGIEYPSEYAGLAHTPTTDLMEGIKASREQFLYDNSVEGLLNSVAGFASLHVAITLLWALMVQYTIRSKVLHWVFWVNFGLTVIATIYFGWHYVADDVAGIAIAVIAFYLGGIASGQKFDKGFHSHPTTTTSKVPID
ncbi:phosphatase PAP2 family protein [Nocardioides panacisoli]|uniref:phosphatase PAP2 family protein n=1 Tax=Nocardioides panacisoli TaxID=627624 RepID=UPI001C631524|nr:phosphatase PAP2 family protein [Nocardioides panacisoli]QYJ03713.1 phosphatase PAP2 family protein [Nocardioides panacisoli]